MLDAERNHTAPMARRKKLFAIAAALAVVAVAVGLAAQYNKESRAAVRKAPVAVPVTVAPVVAKTVPVRLYAIGNVEPFTTVAVKARVDGQILSVHFNEGDEVRQGQLLFEIDPRPFAAALQQVQANLLRDRARGGRATAPGPPHRPRGRPGKALQGTSAEEVHLAGCVRPGEDQSG